MINKVHYEAKENRYNPYMLDGKIVEKFGENVEKLREQKRSIVAFISNEILKKDINAFTYTFDKDTPTLKMNIESKPNRFLGVNEPFANEITPVQGSGCYVPGHILTAAHVVCLLDSNEIDESFIKNTYVVFDFFKESEDQCRTTFDESQVFEIKRVKSHRYSDDNEREDWALLKLKKKVQGRAPMTLNFTPIKKGEEVYLWGFPGGLPLKWTDRGVIVKDNHPNYVECKITALGGNSGGPLCRVSTLEVVAILCSGNKDYLFDKETNTYVSYIIPEKKISYYEICQRISRLQFVKDCIELSSSGFKLKNDVVPPGVESPGLYLLGRCKKCSNNEKSVWRLRDKEGTFQLEELLNKSVCKVCRKENLTVDEIGVYDCHFNIEGTIVQPKQVCYTKNNVFVKKDRFKILEKDKDDKEVFWSSLKISLLT